MAGIVVGVDGSPQSMNALEWALAEADFRHAPVKAVAIIPGATSIWGIAGRDYASEDTQQHVRHAAEAEVDKAVAGHPGLQVSVHIASGVPADELVKASEDADLLVVAARGSGGFAQLLMGSVSSQVAHHARCPVVIVPAKQGH
jgi:nucleotide-binding universal stress UspA family protein